MKEDRSGLLLLWLLCFLFNCYFIFKFSFVGHCEDEEEIWRDWERLGCMVGNSQRINKKICQKRIFIRAQSQLQKQWAGAVGSLSLSTGVSFPLIRIVAPAWTIAVALPHSPQSPHLIYTPPDAARMGFKKVNLTVSHSVSPSQLSLQVCYMGHTTMGTQGSVCRRCSFRQPCVYFQYTSAAQFSHPQHFISYFVPSHVIFPLST